MFPTQVKTIVLIVEEWPWTSPPPRRRKERRVFIRVAFPERAIRRQIKEAGGISHPDKQAWEVRYERAVTLGLTNRIGEDASC